MAGLRAHVLNDDGVIINTIVVDSLDTMPGLVDARSGGSIGEVFSGGANAAPPPAPAPPTIVTMRQARRALLDAGLLDAVAVAIAGIADDTQRARADVEWSTARDVDRNNPFTQFMAASLGLTNADMDALFLAASNF